MKSLKSRLYKGFTLAEVLITLAIIGVVASLTIPTVVRNFNKATYVAALKENYNLLNQAFMILEAENRGSIVHVFKKDTTENKGNGKALNAFLTKLNYAKNCVNDKGCWYDSPKHFLNGTTTNSTFDTDFEGRYEKAILTNGTMVLMCIYNINCTHNFGSGPLSNSGCASIFIDVNGAKGPNTIGRDYFYFWVTKNGIYPFGSFDDGYGCGSGNDYGTSNGCTAKVITEGAMTY